jgi:beta-glucosidase
MSDSTARQPRDIAALVAQMTLEEKASLTAGADMWRTVPVERLGIGSAKFTDGPNGARGGTFFGDESAASACLPCGSALGATWDPELVAEVGAVIADQARTKQARVLLAPTLNLHRSPLGGRNFECFSEDPLLAGKIAAGYVRGVQSRGVAATIKHFVGNEVEFERNTSSSDIDEATLRELYLVPFEMAVREGGALATMTGYNRLNGTFCAEHGELLTRILRQEWGYDGFVMTDWFGVTSTDQSLPAGLDLEMPGPARNLGAKLAEAVGEGQVAEADLDRAVTRLLSVLDRIGALDDPPEGPEIAVDDPEDRAVARRAAAASIVLLENDGVLPLAPADLGRVAVIGPNASRAQIMGGGSATLRPHYRTTPLDALRARLEGRAEVLYEPGCSIDRTAPPLLEAAVGTAPEGGFRVEWFEGQELDTELRATSSHDATSLLWVEHRPGGVSRDFSVRARATYTPTVSGPHLFSMIEAGRARLLVDGAEVIDGITGEPPFGVNLFGTGTDELTGVVELTEGKPVDLVVEYHSRGASFFTGVRLGCHLPVPENAFERAVAAAAQADVAIVVVGTNDDWESEGFDRETMALPGRQLELIDAVVAANPRTVVVLNAGSPLDLDWADAPAAALQCWFGGQEMANAVVDVLLGEAEPGGRLPTTIPLRVEHNPSHGNFPGANSKVDYAEGVFMGYRWYESRALPVRYPFGHGLSYTTWALGEPTLSGQAGHEGDVLRLEVPLTNTGRRAGSQVLQVYVAPPAPPRGWVPRPERKLVGFVKVHAQPGETVTAALELGPRAFAYYDAGDADWAGLRPRVSFDVSVAGAPSHRADPGWYVDGGTYQVQLAFSSGVVPLVAPVEIKGQEAPLSVAAPVS